LKIARARCPTHPNSGHSFYGLFGSMTESTDSDRRAICLLKPRPGGIGCAPAAIAGALSRLKMEIVFSVSMTCTPCASPKLNQAAVRWPVGPGCSYLGARRTPLTRENRLVVLDDPVRNYASDRASHFTQYSGGHSVERIRPLAASRIDDADHPAGKTRSPLPPHTVGSPPRGGPERPCPGHRAFRSS
jgi:hypothetical protein